MVACRFGYVGPRENMDRGEIRYYTRVEISNSRGHIGYHTSIQLIDISHIENQVIREPMLAESAIFTTHGIFLRRA
jgi:hypothetical protein